MRNLAWLCLFVVCLGAAPARAQALSQFSWLVGCWRTDADNGLQTTEVWTAPPMPAVLSYAYMLNAEGELRTWEQSRIEQTRDGAVSYIAMPNGRDAVRFALVDSAASSVAFENPEHDYPKRIAYAREGDLLRATISELAGANAVEFVFRRIECAAPLTP